MKRLWLLLAQTVTVLLAAYFVVATLKPQWLGRLGALQGSTGIDAREGLVATHGWLQTSNVPVLALAQAMRTAGVTHIIFTDIARDGMLSGAAAEATAALARASGLPVIASGGVRDLDDIRRLLALSGAGVAGVIVGQALYTGRLALPDALHLASGSGFQPDGSLSVC